MLSVYHCKCEIPYPCLWMDAFKIRQLCKTARVDAHTCTACVTASPHSSAEAIQHPTVLLKYEMTA